MYVLHSNSSKGNRKSREKNIKYAQAKYCHILLTTKIKEAYLRMHPFKQILYTTCFKQCHKRCAQPVIKINFNMII